MKVLGLVTEYNPFHNGHLYHLRESIRLTDSDYSICIMSGNFIQRGEPALINKWARTKAALMCGIDLVIELPFVFAVSSAESFAYASVNLLNSLGIVNTISFGSESGNLETLSQIAEILNDEPPAYKVIFKKIIGDGLSFPQARELALIEYIKQTNHKIIDIKEIVGSPNNILAIEYLKALLKLKSNITPFTIKRESNAHNDSELTGTISSASAIRNEIISNSSTSFNKAIDLSLPYSSFSILKSEFDNGRGPISAQSFDNIILSSLRRMTLSEIKELPNVTEGLENRIMEAARSSGTLKDLIDSICTKRYTRTRIQRSLYSILGGVTKNDHKIFLESDGPKYIRVLGFTEKGRELLTIMKKSAKLPVIVKTADFKNSDDPHIKRMLEIEAFSTDQYVLGYQNPDFKTSGQEFTQKIVQINI